MHHISEGFQVASPTRAQVAGVPVAHAQGYPFGPHGVPQQPGMQAHMPGMMGSSPLSALQQQQLMQHQQQMFFMQQQAQQQRQQQAQQQQAQQNAFGHMFAPPGQP